MNKIYDRGPFMIASAPDRHIIYENLYKEKISCYFCRPCRMQQEIFAGISFFMKLKKLINSIEPSIVGSSGLSRKEDSSAEQDKKFLEFFFRFLELY